MVDEGIIVAIVIAILLLIVVVGVAYRKIQQAQSSKLEVQRSVAPTELSPRITPRKKSISILLLDNIATVGDQHRKQGKRLGTTDIRSQNFRARAKSVVGGAPDFRITHKGPVRAKSYKLESNSTVDEEKVELSLISERSLLKKFRSQRTEDDFAVIGDSFDEESNIGVSHRKNRSPTIATSYSLTPLSSLEASDEHANHFICRESNIQETHEEEEQNSTDALTPTTQEV